jgi:hypothetical protein
MAIQPDERIVVETPVRYRGRLVPMGIIVTGISAGLAGVHPGGAPGLAIGLLGLVFFGPLTVALVLRMVRNRPVLIMDADGFTDQGSLISAGYVPWQEVQRIEERPFGRRIFVAVTVTDPEALRARQPAWRRLLYRINGRTAAGDIFIPDNVLPMSPTELARTMRRLHRAAQRRPRSKGTDRRA